MSHRRYATGLSVIAALMLVGCGRAEPDAQRAADADPAVAIRSFMFDPGTVRVNADTTVVWANEDDIAHTVTSGMPGESGVPGVSQEAKPEPDGFFDEPLAGVGDTVSVAFEEPGTYPYFCAIHDGMTGVVEVS